MSIVFRSLEALIRCKNHNTDSRCIAGEAGIMTNFLENMACMLFGWRDRH